MSRRGALLGGVAAALAGMAVPASFAASVPARSDGQIVTLDWALAATLMEMGLQPVGVPAPRWYDRIVVEPALPDDVVDVGLLFTPNFELLQQMAPGLILIGPGLRSAEPMLRRIAPVAMFALAAPGPKPYGRAEEQTLALADQLGRRAAGERFIADVADQLAAARRHLAGRQRRPLCVASLVDDRHVRIFGGDGLFHDVLDRLGLIDAGAELVPHGEAATLGLTQLAGLPDVELLCVAAPGAAAAGMALMESPIWQAMPFARRGRVSFIPSVSTASALPGALRFARLVQEAFATAKLGRSPESSRE
ncbi:ABC transporter substrate-binding protein [Azorhizobium sp. AG788]|uniref:ABC transporter substrate-binding protein n=1 Tax=Azorhizobium sp. AG788 TaxID=2183897 RepID=UPI003139C32D